MIKGLPGGTPDRQTFLKDKQAQDWQNRLKGDKADNGSDQ